jgi:hypothetical protein
MIRSEFKDLIGGQVVMLKCRVFGGKTGPFPVGRVFRGVRPVATVWFRVEPEPEPTPEFGLVANTSSASAFTHIRSIGSLYREYGLCQRRYTSSINGGSTMFGLVNKVIGK